MILPDMDAQLPPTKSPEKRLSCPNSSQVSPFFFLPFVLSPKKWRERLTFLESAQMASFKSAGSTAIEHEGVKYEGRRLIPEVGTKAEGDKGQPGVGNKANP